MCDAEIETGRNTRLMNVKREFCSNPCVKRDCNASFAILANGTNLRTYVKVL